MRFLSIVVLLISSITMAQQPQQIVINVERQDFKPLQEVSWRVLVGNSSIVLDDSNARTTGNGLGVGIERIVSERWSVGAHYMNARSLTVDSNNQIIDENGVFHSQEYRGNVNALSAYGKFSFVNFPINRWNLIQVSFLGGVANINWSTEVVDAFYGAAASYNYDNLIGFEFNTKVNIRAESSTSANLIGYF